MNSSAHAHLINQHVAERAEERNERMLNGGVSQLEEEGGGPADVDILAMVMTMHSLGISEDLILLALQGFQG